MIFRAAVLSLLTSLILLQLVISRSPTAPTVVVSNHPAAAPAATAEPFDPASTRLTADTVMVDVRRDEIERLRPKALSSARVVPQLHRGAVDGMRIYGIHRGSLWQTLGLRNGDVVQRYNGRVLSDPKGLACLGDCPSSPDFLDLTVKRRGRTIRIVVLIHSA
jgi:type II secretory pathway component PulC